MVLARQDRIILLILFVYTLLSALSLPVNPWPRDGWFESQYLLFDRLPGGDNYTPIAAPAFFYKLIHLLGVPFSLDLRGEMYLASLLQNLLILLGSIFTYAAGRLLAPPWLSGLVAVAFHMLILSTGLPQAFWSENIIYLLFAWTLYLCLRLYLQPPAEEVRFWRLVIGIGLLIGVLAATRVTPLFLIPGLALLLVFQIRFKRLLGLLTIVTSISAIMLLALAASNYVRFDRFELTNSSGRHLWQGVRHIAEEALADSSEFQALKTLNPDIQGKNHWKVQVPIDAASLEGRQHIDPAAQEELAVSLAREEVLGRLAKEAIASKPWLYIRLGASKFSEVIGGRPYHLGFGGRGNQYDPLETDQPLRPLAETWSVLLVPATKIFTLFNLSVFWGSGWLYPVVIVLIMVSFAALAFNRFGPTTDHSSIGGKLKTGAFTLAGFTMLSIVNASSFQGVASVVTSPLVILVLCLAVLALQIVLFHRGAIRCSGAHLSVYAFLAFMFFGSLWFSWQIETANSRNALPYLPFMALMTCMSLSYWLEAASRALKRIPLQEDRAKYV